MKGNLVHSLFFILIKNYWLHGRYNKELSLGFLSLLINLIKFLNESPHILIHYMNANRRKKTTTRNLVNKHRREANGHNGNSSCTATQITDGERRRFINSLLIGALMVNTLLDTLELILHILQTINKFFFLLSSL